MAYDDYRMTGILGQDRETLRKALDDPSLTESQRQEITTRHNIYNGVMLSADPFADNYGGTKPMQYTFADPNYKAPATPQQQIKDLQYQIRKLENQYKDVLKLGDKRKKSLFGKKKYPMTVSQINIYDNVRQEIKEMQDKIREKERQVEKEKREHEAWVREEKERMCNCNGSGGCY